MKTIKQKIEDREVCCDCLTDCLTPALPCSRGEGRHFVQCVDCFDTFTEWYMDRITIEEAKKIFHKRRIANGYESRE